METENTNNLSGGIGNKIVDALKQQNQPTVDSFEMEDDSFLDEDFDFNEVESINEDEEANNNIQVTIEPQEKFSPEEVEQEIEQEQPIIEEVVEQNKQEVNSFIDSLEANNIKQEEITLNEEPVLETIEPEPITQEVVKQVPINIVQPQEITTEPKSDKIIVTANVETLTKLVSQLPVGVTRQTGAQIIRQTMEAMGISMNKVLSEAQESQEKLGSAVRENMNKSEEYKTRIKNLEKQIQSYRKQSSELDDLINLFIMADKSNRVK